MGGVYINNKAQGTAAAQFLTKSFAWRSCDGARFNYGLSTNHGPLIGPGKTRIDDGGGLSKVGINCATSLFELSCTMLFLLLHVAAFVPLTLSVSVSVPPFILFSSFLDDAVARNSWNQSDCEFHASVQIHPKTKAVPSTTRKCAIL